MKRFPLFGILMLMPAFALVFLVGCPAPTKKPTGDGAVASDAKGGGEKDKSKGKTGPLVEITTDTDGNLKGFVKFEGTPPDPKPLPAIAAHKEAMACMAGEKVDKINVIDQEWIVTDGKVANVAIYLAPPSGKKFKITEALKKPFEKPVVMDQPFCMFVPHVAAVYAGIQPFEVKNSSHVNHNVKIVGNKNPSSDDFPKQGTTTKARTYEKESGPINISCSIHTWMTAKLLTFDQPYFAVTKEDGTFEIKNAPIDVELSVWMWHESMGPKGMEVKTMSLKKGDNPIELKLVKK